MSCGMWALTLQHVLAAFNELALTNTSFAGTSSCIWLHFHLQLSNKRWCHCQKVYVKRLSDLTA